MELYQSEQVHNNRLEWLWLLFFRIPVMYCSSSFKKWKNNQRLLLLCIIVPIERKKLMKTASFLGEKCIFLQDNAPAHKLIKTIPKINELRFVLLLLHLILQTLTSYPGTWELAAPTMDPTSSCLLPLSTAIGWLNEEDAMSSRHLWWRPPASFICSKT